VRPWASDVVHREPGARKVTPLPHHALAFQDVHYSYPATDDRQTTKEALQGISFTVRPGQRVAFVGASGAGKTTIASLLLRFMEPTSGAITVDDQPIQQITAQEWRKMVAWQPQHPYMFNTTIAENIRLGCADAPMEEVIRVAQAADMHDFIRSLPQGYETVIGERGTRLIVDEATSTLDVESEARVFQTINNVLKDRMVLIIAHRLNTIQDADQIIVLQEGRIAAHGTHQSLLQSSPLYQNLVRAYEGKEISL
jgi:ATP-binding cassette, subfamily C, bacterial CydD